MADLQVIKRIDVMYIRSVLKSMRIGLTFKMISTVAKDKALLDSGATENFLDLQAWKELRIGCFQLEKPVPVQNIDGTSNSTGSIKYFCWLKIKIKEHKRRMKFFLTNLGNNQFILGYPFLKEFNPRINWEKAQLLDGNWKLRQWGFDKHKKRCSSSKTQQSRSVGNQWKGMCYT